MTSTANGRVVPGQLDSFGVPPFDGYPYLVTRIGHSPLRHILVLPADWTRERLVDLARRQRDANRLDTCLAVGRRDGLYLAADDTEWQSDHMPYGSPVSDRLRPADSVPETAELADRRARLAAFVDANRGPRYLVGDGLEDGRPADPDDIDRLSSPGIDGLPAGLRRCPTCAQLAGDYLAVKGEGNGDPTPRVIEVHCACANHNRCVWCGKPLAASRLSAYSYDDDRKVWYRAAYSGTNGFRRRGLSPRWSKTQAECSLAPSPKTCRKNSPRPTATSGERSSMPAPTSTPTASRSRLPPSSGGSTPSYLAIGRSASCSR
jgi:hypothetical protein